MSELAALFVLAGLWLLGLALYRVNRRRNDRYRATERAERVLARADEDPVTAETVRDEREIHNARELRRRGGAAP